LSFNSIDEMGIRLWLMRSLRSFMQVKPTSVTVLLPNGESRTMENATCLMADFGLWVKTENELEMFTWERVSSLKFANEEVNKVWEEAVLTVFEDLLEDLEDEFEDDEEESEEDETPASSNDTPASGDDPEANPYA